MWESVQVQRGGGEGGEDNRNREYRIRMTFLPHDLYSVSLSLLECVVILSSGRLCRDSVSSPDIRRGGIHQETCITSQQRNKKNSRKKVRRPGAEESCIDAHF